MWCWRPPQINTHQDSHEIVAIARAMISSYNCRKIRDRPSCNMKKIMTCSLLLWSSAVILLLICSNGSSSYSCHAFSSPTIISRPIIPTTSSRMTAIHMSSSKTREGAPSAKNFQLVCTLYNSVSITIAAYKQQAREQW